MNKWLGYFDSFMALLIGMAVGAVVAMIFFPVVPFWAGYLCAAGLVAAEYWQYRFIQDEVNEYYDTMWLKAMWNATKD